MKVKIMMKSARDKKYYHDRLVFQSTRKYTRFLEDKLQKKTIHDKIIKTQNEDSLFKFNNYL